MDREQMLEQHDAIVTHVNRLEYFVGGDAKDLPEARARALLRQHLQALQKVLLAHFAAEEEGGYFAAVLEDRPDLRPRADSIAAQHGALAAKLSATIGQTNHGASAAAVAAAVGEFVGALREHEAAERELVLVAALQDTGVGD